MPGLNKTLSHYEILGPIGRGGMGQVYAALDTTLGRRVAIKVLPPEMAADAGRLARFEREARAIAALNHPHIVTIYSVEQADGVHFITMELVEGRTLADLIPAGGLPLAKLLPIAVDVAGALSIAHQSSITHRDIKPANVMILDDGRVKVLDFGLAKLARGSGDDHEKSITQLVPVDDTVEGQLLGTVAYMSPEQAEGKPIDARSDIFSFGVLLYEMATGARPFKGDTNVSVISSILRDTPRPITETNRALPRDLARIVKRCLMKDVDLRYQSSKDLRNDLAELHKAIESGEITGAETATVAGSAAPARSRSMLRAAGLVAVGAVAGALAAYGIASKPDRSGEAPVTTVYTQLTTQGGLEQFPSLSPDGKWVVYAADTSGSLDVYLQSVGGQTPINLTSDSPDRDWAPVFSPDGERIAFTSTRGGGGIFVMGRTGESVRRVTDAGFNPSWAPTGTEIVFATEDIVDRPWRRGAKSALLIVNVSTGEKRELTTGDAVQPHWSPHGDRIAFWTTRLTDRRRDIATISARGGDFVFVTDDAAVDWNPVWSPDGRHLFFASDRGGSMNLWRVAIDERSGRVLGAPEAVTTPSKFAAHVSFSADGHRMAYAAMEFAANLERVPFDAAAAAVTGPPLAVTSGSKLWQSGVDVSNDGQWLLLASDRPQEDVYVAKADGSGLRQVTNDAAFDRTPVWSPDGKQIAFQSNRGDSWEAWRINPDGSGLAPITKQSGLHRPIYAPDGSRMVASEFVNVNRVSIFDPRVPWERQTAQALPPPRGSHAWIATAWSRDGARLAGVTIQGELVVYSSATGTLAPLGVRGDIPLWLNDGRRIVFGSLRGLAVIDSESTRVRDVKGAPPVDSSVLAGISRDNRFVYLLRRSTSSDVWLSTVK